MMNGNDINKLRELLLKTLVEYGKYAVDDMVNETYGLIPTNTNLQKMLSGDYKDPNDLLLGGKKPNGGD